MTLNTSHAIDLVAGGVLSGVGTWIGSCIFPNVMRRCTGAVRARSLHLRIKLTDMTATLWSAYSTSQVTEAEQLLALIKIKNSPRKLPGGCLPSKAPRPQRRSREQEGTRSRASMSRAGAGGLSKPLVVDRVTSRNTGEASR